MLRTVLIVLAIVAPGILQAQSNSVGVPPYHPSAPAEYRAIYGAGGNLGLFSDAPTSEVFLGSYQKGPAVFSFGVVSNTSNGGYPRRTISEFDVLAGYAWDATLPRYQGPPNLLHFSLSTGIGLNTYSTRLRRFGQFSDSTFFLDRQSNQTQFSLGLPVQFEAIYEPMQNFGIGGLLFLNISNFTPSYGGAVVVEARY